MASTVSDDPESTCRAARGRFRRIASPVRAVLQMIAAAVCLPGELRAARRLAAELPPGLAVLGDESAEVLFRPDESRP